MSLKISDHGASDKKFTAQKVKFSVKHFFSKCIISAVSHLLKESLIENFIFGTVVVYHQIVKLVIFQMTI